MSSLATLIVYACPVGPLAAQIDTYLQQSKQQCGPNAAHAYMPHCTLTGFFTDDSRAIPLYIDALDKAIADAATSELSVAVTELAFHDDWHGLVLQADRLKQMVTVFATRAASPTRKEALRLKDWLHLSLAYDFAPEASPQLQQLAAALIDIEVAVSWELRFYERKADNQWICHHRWPM